MIYSLSIHFILFISLHWNHKILKFIREKTMEEKQTYGSLVDEESLCEEPSFHFVFIEDLLIKFKSLRTQN